MAKSLSEIPVPPDLWAAWIEREAEMAKREREALARMLAAEGERKADVPYTTFDRVRR